MKTLRQYAWAAIALPAILLPSLGHGAITVIDYYQLGEADPGAINGATVNATSLDSAGTKHLTRIGSPTYTNGVSPEAAARVSSQLAVTFSGSSQGLSNGIVSTVTDNFGIEAWARPNTASGNHSIAYNGNTALSGWGIYQLGGNYGGLMGGVTIVGAAPVTVNVWTHVALVRASGVSTLYINGVSVATAPNAPNVPAGGFCVGMAGQGGGIESFSGQIDEVRVFTFAAGQFSTNDLLLNATSSGLATMNDTLQTDVNGNSRFNPGDTVRYTVVITNNTGGTLSNVVFNSTAVPNAPEVAASLRAAPLARADAPVSNSVPGNAFHGALNSTLFMPAGSGLLANDFLGVPAAKIASFGGGSFPGTTPAGFQAINPTVGTLMLNADGSFALQPNPTITGLVTFNYRLTNSVGTNDVTVTLAVGIRPAVVNESYLVTGNVRVNSALIPQSLLTNDTGSLLVISTNTAPANGTVSITNSTGHFIYTPNRGFTGADSFSYTITNGFGSATGTVTLTVSNRVWSVDSSAAGGGDGRAHAPYNTLAAFNAVNNNVAPNPQTNDIIVIRDGGYGEGVTLLNGQRVIGDGWSGTFEAAAGFALAPGSDFVTTFSGVDPLLVLGGNGNGVNLALNNQLRGFTVRNCDLGYGFAGSAVGDLVIAECSKTGSGGVMYITNSGAFGTNVNFDTLESTSTIFGGNLNLVGVTGTLATTGVGAGFAGSQAGLAAVNISGGSLTLAYAGPVTKANAGRLFDLQNRTGGTLTFSGNLSASGGSTGVLCNNNTGGTINFSGATKTLNTGTSTAVSLTSNNGATINFTGGGLAITTTSATGFNATGGGTVTVTTGANANTISSTTGTALNVASTTIGASGMTFQSITSSGGSATGIILDTTGASGGLTVTGTGGAGSGGTIANKTGADGSTTTGIGIYLNNTANISFSRMQMNGLQNFGIRGLNVTNFIFNDSVINGLNGSTGGAFDEAAISFNTLLGSASLSRCNIAHGLEYVVKILNNSGTLNRLTVDTTTFGANDNALGGDALQIVASQTSTINVTVTNCTFTNAREDLFNAAVTQTANMDLVFRNNNLGNNHANKVSAASNFLLFSTSTGTVTYDVSHNTMTTGATGSALAVAKGVPDTGSGGTMTGTVKANTIGLNGVVGSGSQFTGIFASALGSGTHTTLVDNNIIYHYNEEGIFLKANDPLTGGNSVLNATLTANQTLQPDSLAFAGLWIVAGAGSGTESQVVNVLLGNSSTAFLQNDFTAGDPANSTDVFFQESGSSSAINLSRAGSVSGTVALVVADDNVGTPAVVSSGTVNLVNTTPALPPPVAP